MAHCGYEPTAAADATNNPLKAMMMGIKGPKLDGPMAPEINMDNARPANDIYEELVQEQLDKLDAAE